MTIALTLDAAREARLQQVARRRGLTADELARRYLDEGLARDATADGTPPAEATEERVDYLARYLESQTWSREERIRRSLEVIGKHDAGVTDLAENHDKYYAEAADERLR